MCNKAESAYMDWRWRHTASRKKDDREQKEPWSRYADDISRTPQRSFTTAGIRPRSAEASHHPSSFGGTLGEGLGIQVQNKATNVSLARQPSGTLVYHSVTEPLDCRYCPSPARHTKYK